MIQNNIRERMRQFIAFLGVSERKFEIENGFYNGFVGKMNKIDGGKIALLEKKYPNLNITWLLTGEGDMLKKEATKQNNGEGNVQMYNYLSNKNNLNVSNNDIIRVLQEEVQYLKEQNKKLLDLLLKKEEQ